MKLIFIFLIVTTSFFAKEVELSATVKYENNTNQDIKGIYLKVHIPPETFYQKLLNINVFGVSSYKIKKHSNSSEKYVDLSFNLPAQSVSIKKIIYKLNIEQKEVDISKKIKKYFTKYTKDSKNIEVSSKEIQSLSKRIKKSKSRLYDRIRLAYEFPSSYLKFNPQSKKTSALYALNSGYGDCTEYSYIFVALARSLNIPSRTISVFAFKNNNKFKMPNHNASEIYIEKYNWFPVYPNLSRGKYYNEYALGKVSDNIIVFMQEKNWTWSSYISKKNKINKKDIQTSIEWEVKEIQ